MIASPSPDLHELASRLARLRPCWQRPEAFFEARSDLAAERRRMARQGPPEALGRAAGPTARERRLEALARSQAAEIDRLREMLAEAAPPRPRQSSKLDPQQLSPRIAEP
jgi:hypothetical protein